MLIRAETAGDFAAVDALNAAAFGGRGEADLVAALRRDATPIVSLVAEEGGTVAGHILFSPVTLNGHETLKIMGLAPMAVTPERQRRGIGTQLVRAGLAACRELHFGAAVVLGHPEYYPRFGFRPAQEFGIGCEYDVPADVFMALELTPGYLRGKTGTVRYHPAFAACG
jgi:putative acetyltransferase